MMQADVAVIGGGIVGLAIAYQVTQQFPSRRVIVLEKEANVAAHQTGHNSGVLHSGIYYKPGSLKAINCRAGKQAMEAFCTTEAIPFEICGKVIVALDDSELPARGLRRKTRTKTEVLGVQETRKPVCHGSRGPPGPGERGWPSCPPWRDSWGFSVFSVAMLGGHLGKSLPESRVLAEAPDRGPSAAPPRELPCYLPL
jgi:hypothetical protein